MSCSTCDHKNYENVNNKLEQSLDIGNLLIRCNTSGKNYRLAVKDDPKSEFVLYRYPTCGQNLFEHTDIKLYIYIKGEYMVKNVLLEIYSYENIKQLQSLEKTYGDYMGIFYVLEYNNCVKIGSSKEPYIRYRALKHNAEKYGNSSIGRIAISEVHTNYRENENKIHKLFSDYRNDGTELFNMSFDNCIKKLNTMSLDFLDESKKKDEQAEAFANMMKNFILGGRKLL